MASASLSRASCLSDGVESRQDSKALPATSNALSTSAPFEIGASANASPVAGLTRSEERLSLASTYSPPTKFCSLFFFVSTMSSPFLMCRPGVPLILATLDNRAQPLLRAHAQGLAVGEDHGRKIFREQLLRGAPRQRGVGAEGLAHADPDLVRKTAEGISCKEEAVRVAQERDVPKRVAGRGDDAKTGDEVPLAQNLRDRRGRYLLAVRDGPEDGAGGFVSRASAGDDLRLVLGSSELRLRRPLDQTRYAAGVVGVVVRQEDPLEVFRPGADRDYGLPDAPDTIRVAGVNERPAIIVLQEQHVYDVGEPNRVHAVNTRGDLFGSHYIVLCPGSSPGP